jgi:hypothetical protein
MNLYTLFEGSNKKKVREDFNGLQYGVQENDGLSGSLSTDNGVAAVQDTDNDLSPIGSYDYEDDHGITENDTPMLDEVAMNPTAFAQAIQGGADKGVLVGFEFETLIPASAVNTWKNGPQAGPVGYDATSTAWIEGKTVRDLLNGIKTHSGGSNSQTYEKWINDLFKYKASVKAETGNSSLWSHYRNWADTQIRARLEAERTASPVIEKLKELLKNRAFARTPVSWMDHQAEQRYGNIPNLSPKTLLLHVLKEKTGIDFSGRVAKSALTPEVITKIKDTCQHLYRVTRNPIDQQYSEVANAVDARRDELYKEYIPGWSYRQPVTDETETLFQEHFTNFCTQSLGSDNLKTLLQTKLAFKGRVNNNTETLKEKLWFFVTPGAEEPSSMRARQRSYTSYSDGADYLKANLKDVFGDNMVIFTNYHQASKKLDRWYIEPDGSLRPNSGDYAAEVVSPPLKSDAAMAALRTWYQKAETLKFYTNNSTGLHINVSIPDKIDVLKLAVFAGDQHVLKQFGREDNSYARSVIKSLKGQGNLPELGSIEFKQAEKQMKELITRISGDHFATVNFNGKYVSFRHAGGDYLKKEQDITNTVGRFVRAMLLAADPAAHRDEYVAKLVKIMKTPEVPTSDKLGLTDIRAIASRGIPVQYIDFVATQGSNPAEAQSAADEYAKSNYGYNKVNIIITADPTARERLLADRGFSSVTKEHIQNAPEEMFFRAEIFPTTRRSLESFANRFSNYGTDRGSAFGMYGQSRDKRAVGVTAMTAVKQTDPGFVNAVKALRGEATKPIPLPGTKAAPKVTAASFASQRTGQDPAQVQPRNTREIPSAGSTETQPQPSSDDESEPAGEERTYNILGTDGDVLQHYNGTLADTRRVAQSVADRVDDTVYIMDNGSHVATIRPAESASNTEGTADTYRFVLASTRETLTVEHNYSIEAATDLAEDYAEHYGETILIYDGDGDLVDQISPSEGDAEEESNTPSTWTLNNGEMVRHYDSTQVNSDRAYELAREMYSQYSRPVTISRDGTTYGHWPHQQQPQAAEYEFRDTDGNVRARAEFSSDDIALQQAAEMAQRRAQVIIVYRGERIIGHGYPNGQYTHVTAGSQEQSQQQQSTQDYFWRFVNPENQNVIDSFRSGDENAMRQLAQTYANRANAPIALTRSGRPFELIEPQELTESRIFHSDEKVNVVYQPHNSNAKVIVAKAVDHMMASKVINSYVHRSKQNPNRAPVTAKDFVLNPAKGYTTAESQDGSGVTSPGGGTSDDSTSPIHGFNEDRQPMSQMSRELLRVARQSNPEALSDTDAINAYMSSIAKKTQDNYKQVNNILRQLDPLSNELDNTERELHDVERVNKSQQELLRRLSQRVDQAKTQTLPSQQRAADVPTQQAAAKAEKERDDITQKLDRLEKPAQTVQQPVSQAGQPAAAVADTQARQDIASVTKQIQDLEQKMYAKDTTDKARAGIIRDMNKLKSTLGGANPDKIRDLARSLHITEPEQQELPFNEDEVMESHLYALKRAGYDIL